MTGCGRTLTTCEVRLMHYVYWWILMAGIAVASFGLMMAEFAKADTDPSWIMLVAIAFMLSLLVFIITLVEEIVDAINARDR